MESSSHPLAIESFSNSWLTGTNSSLQTVEGSSGASLASSSESAQKLLRFERSLGDTQSFKFDVPFTKSSTVLVHADQIFSGGLIRPTLAHQSKTEPSSPINLVPFSKPPSSFSHKPVMPVVDIQGKVQGRWKRRLERILQKCFRNLRPLCLGYRRSRKCVKVDDIDRRSWEVKSWSNSPPYHSPDSWSDIDFESSIYEAVLHCKKSIDNK
ncbi:hypothetical protein K2173_025345 [Erythroxylum novogranatense]|uniref:Membrane-associated kinase regulator 6 n=1 Tax=Erythroxylum novogranatense TaxID=1862640 RepID=A0AAV8UGA5_9ROSI|nr:hypothetical protein K2173_025345 [Erythroxylum novogranatense]